MGGNLCTIRSERQSVRLRRRRCFSGNTLVPTRKVRGVTEGKKERKEEKGVGAGTRPSIRARVRGAKTRIKVNEGLYRKKFLEILLLL